MRLTYGIPFGTVNVTMNHRRQDERNLKIVKFLTTPLSFNETGRRIFPTSWDAAVKFDLSLTHVYRIKKLVLGSKNKKSEDENAQPELSS